MSFVGQFFQQRFASTAALSTLYDVAIVGGGPVGNAMACALGKSEILKNKRVVVLEGGQPKRLGKPPPIYSNKVFACTPSSIRMFQDFDVWNDIKNYRVKEISGLYVLDACSRSKVEFYSANDSETISHLIEDSAITKALYGRVLDSCKNVEYRTSVKVQECHIPEDISQTVRLTLSDGSEIRSLLVIGADGFRSGIRKAMKISSTGFDYNQTAIVGTLEIDSKDNNSIAWQRFTPLGPIALLPLTDKLSSLVWTTTTSDAKRLLQLPIEKFVEELNHYLFSQDEQSKLANQALDTMDKLATMFRLSGVADLPQNPPAVIRMISETKGAFPLGFNNSHCYVKARAALIGDAAHRVHPLAGQGVNLGWSDVRLLTKVLEDADVEGADLGSLTYLSKYDTYSQRHNLPVMICVDWLNRLYKTSSAPLVLLRSIGLHAVDKMTPIKDFIMNRASH